MSQKKEVNNHDCHKQAGAQCKQVAALASGTVHVSTCSTQLNAVSDQPQMHVFIYVLQAGTLAVWQCEVSQQWRASSDINLLLLCRVQMHMLFCAVGVLSWPEAGCLEMLSGEGDASGTCRWPAP